MALRRSVSSAKAHLSAALVAAAPRLERASSSLASIRRLAGRRLSAVSPLAPYAVDAASPIVLVNNALAWGGAERQVVNTLRGLERRLRRPIGLLCLKLGESGDYAFYRPALETFGGFVRDMISAPDAVTELRRRFGDDSEDTIQAAAGWMPRDVRDTILRLTADFAILRPAVVHAWQDALSIEAAYAARFIGVPKIVTAARNMAPTHFAYGRPHMRAAYRELAGCAEIVMLANSDAGADDYARWIGMPRHRFSVIRNGLDFPGTKEARTDARNRLRASLGIPEAAPVVGSIFRFYDEKQPLLWMEVAARVAERAPNVHFLVFGVGPLAAAAQAEAQRRGFADRYRNPGLIENVAEALSAFDCFLLTSKFEGTPNVVLEASSLGVPVVATPAGGTSEAVDEGRTGFIVSDAAGLAAGVLRVLDDRAWRTACLTAAPEFCRNRFGLDRMVTETIAAYGLGGEDLGVTADVLHCASERAPRL